MKKIITAVILLFIAGLSPAQMLKVEAGRSFSQIDFIYGFGKLEFDKTIEAYSLFIGGSVNLNKELRFSTNLGYIKKGGALELEKTSYEYPDGTGEYQTFKLGFEYISLNLPLDFRFNRGGTIRPFVSMGPRVDHLINKTGDKAFFNFSKWEEEDAFNKFTYGMLLGGGFDVNLGRIEIGVKANYYVNFVNIAKLEYRNGKTVISEDTFALYFTAGFGK